MDKLQCVDARHLNVFKEVVKFLLWGMVHDENTLYHMLAFRQGKD